MAKGNMPPMFGGKGKGMSAKGDKSKVARSGGYPSPAKGGGMSGGGGGASAGSPTANPRSRKPRAI